jgi:hypothetical protein
VHSQYLALIHKWESAGVLANRALDLMNSRLKPETYWGYAAIVAARARGLGGANPSPKRAAEWLRRWSDSVSMSKWPQMDLWIQSDLAKYRSAMNEHQSAVFLAEQAVRKSVEAGDHVETICRRWDLATVLIDAGRPDDAISVALESDDESDSVTYKTQLSLMLAEAYGVAGQQAESQQWILSARNLINAHHLEYLRLELDRVGARLSE